MNVFKAAMTYRYSFSAEGVHALNSIPIVFAKDKAVRECWKQYYSDLCIANPSSLQMKKRNEDLYKLLESMASVLGYKKLITWEDIQNPYYPAGMARYENNNEIISNHMASMLLNMANNSPKENQ